MTNYVDVFVVPVPESKIEAYRKQAELFAKVWREHGAISCIDVEADDVKPGTWTSFPAERGPEARRESVRRHHHLQIARPPRRGQCQGDEGRAHGRHEAGIHAVRRQTHDLRRVQAVRRRMTGKARRCDPRAAIMGSGVPRWNDTQRERRRDDEVHDYSQGQQELGGRSHAERRAAHCHGQV